MPKDMKIMLIGQVADRLIKVEPDPDEPMRHQIVIDGVVVGESDLYPMIERRAERARLAFLTGLNQAVEIAGGVSEDSYVGQPR